MPAKKRQLKGKKKWLLCHDCGVMYKVHPRCKEEDIKKYQRIKNLERIQGEMTRLQCLTATGTNPAEQPTLDANMQDVDEGRDVDGGQDDNNDPLPFGEDTDETFVPPDCSNTVKLNQPSSAANPSPHLYYPVLGGFPDVE